jgi:cysteinyl-tRNA synthetase
MVMKHLGETIDIHSGGLDLIFPHHENEIAQSEAATGKPFARYWLHNGFINVNNEKMSKSKGNFFTVRDIVKEFDYEVIRFFMLSAHYRGPINFSDDLLMAAKNSLERIYTCIKNLDFLASDGRDSNSNPKEAELKGRLLELKGKFVEAMDDDLNTADAIAAIFEMVKEINTAVAIPNSFSKETIIFARDLLKELGSVLGILQKDESQSLDKEIEELVAKRQQARKDKNWKLADEIRDRLKEKGFTLEDTPQGVKVVRK